MSLINDALKQTKQSQPQSPPSNPPPLPPVESAAPGARKLAGAGGDYFVARRRRNFHRPVLVQTRTAVAQYAVDGRRGHATSGNRRSLSPPVATNPPPDTNTAAAVAARAAGAEAARHFVRRHAPCAIVNGKTVFVGDQMNEFRVTAISKDSVTLQSETETNVLSLSPR